MHSKKLFEWDDTCNIELNLHRHLIGQSRVSEQLVGLLQSAILSRDPVDGQQSVADLQQATPAQGNKARDELLHTQQLFIRKFLLDKSAAKNAIKIKGTF